MNHSIFTAHILIYLFTVLLLFHNDITYFYTLQKLPSPHSFTWWKIFVLIFSFSCVTGVHASHPVWPGFSLTCWSECQLCHRIDHLNSTNNASLVISTLDVFLFFSLSHYFQLLYHNHPSHFTATHPSPPHSSQSNTKDRQRRSFLIKFYFISAHLYFSFSWPAEVCLMSIDVDTIVRISQNKREIRPFVLLLKETLGLIVLLASWPLWARVWLFPDGAREDTESQTPGGTNL